MNENQATGLVRNQIHVSNLGDAVARPVQRQLEQWVRELSEVVEQLPGGVGAEEFTLFREARWRGYRTLLQQQLLLMDQQLHQDIIEAAADIPTQIKAAEAWMIENARQNIRDGVPAEDSDWPYQRVDERSPMPPAVLVEKGYGEIVNFPGVATGGPAPYGQPYFAPAQLTRVAQDTKVLGVSMDQLFTPLGVRPPVFQPYYGSQFIKRNIQIVDNIVKRGFLLGETNHEISKRLFSEGSARTKTEAQTIARTAVQQMANDAHNDFWKANRSVIGGWEYDASFDFRVCPICLPWDGRTARKRDDLPTTPVHPRCRCRVLPLTETEIRLRERDGPQRRMVQELVDGDRPKPGGALARKVTVDGKRYWRVNKRLKPEGGQAITAGEWMDKIQARRRKDGTEDPTALNILGPGGLDRFRAARAAGQSPDEALVRATQRVRDYPSVKKRGRTPKLTRSRPSTDPLHTKTKFTDRR